MEKRLILFVTLSLVIILLYPFFITWVSGPTQRVPSVSQNENTGNLPTEPAQETPAEPQQNVIRESTEKIPPKTQQEAGAEVNTADQFFKFTDP